MFVAPERELPEARSGNGKKIPHAPDDRRTLNVLGASEASSL
jgi:hypothetical protein